MNTRNTRTFTDIDLSFIASPSTGDISKKYDENAIKQAVKNLILTRHYERPFHPEIGSQVSSLLFENNSPLLDATLQRAIIYTIENFEPRVELISVDINSLIDEYTIDVTITFKILNTEKPLTISLILYRAR